MSKTKGSRSENHYRSHCSMELGRDMAIQILGESAVKAAEKKMRGTIKVRLEEDGDKEKRGFQEKWLVSLYTTGFVVKKEKPAAAAKKDDKKAVAKKAVKKVAGNDSKKANEAALKKLESKKLVAANVKKAIKDAEAKKEAIMDIRKSAVTSTQLVAGEFLDKSKQVEHKVM